MRTTVSARCAPSAASVRVAAPRRPAAARRCAAVAPPRPLRLRVAASGHPAGASAPAAKGGAGHGHGHGHAGPPMTGFIAEMRSVAMKLHTKEQAPKEGQRAPEQKPMVQWQPTKEGYLSFLIESKAVYDCMEGIVATDKNPIYAKFRNTGLERGAALAKDIAWMKEQGAVAPPQAAGAGAKYAAYLKQLSTTDAPGFLCHWYNVYFAHTAGGRMIGGKVAKDLLGGASLAFYEWEGDLATHMSAVRESINAVAEGWSREEKDACLAETELSFKYSGELLRLIAGGPAGH